MVVQIEKLQVINIHAEKKNVQTLTIVNLVAGTLIGDHVLLGVQIVSRDVHAPKKQILLAVVLDA